MALHSISSCQIRLRNAGQTAHCLRAALSTTSKSQGYADTLPNLKIGARTRVLFQGFTGTDAEHPSLGRQATANVKESLAWGTKIVGGVKPGVEGEHLGLPVFPSVRVAQEKTKPDATAVYVPGSQTAQAIEEAIDAEIPLVVAVAEHVPIHDIIRIHSILKTQSKSRLVGANCPGIISVIGRCRIGFQPLPCFSTGHIGIVAKSGTLSYETVASTTRAGLGQSLCISMGGDMLAGTTLVDALKIFEHDDDTHGIIVIGEVGGTAEVDAAEWIKDYRRRTVQPKPIMALVGGLEAPPGRVMGHAGAWAAPGEPDARAKLRALEDAGAVIVNHPEKFGEGMKTLLNNSARRPQPRVASVAKAQQGFHTFRRAALQRNCPTTTQSRNLYISQSQAFDLLREKDVPVLESNEQGKFSLLISIDRPSLSPCVVASPSVDPQKSPGLARKFPFDYGNPKFAASDSELQAICSHVGLGESFQRPLGMLIHNLIDIFVTREAVVLETKVGATGNGDLQVHGARFAFDDAAFRSSKRQGEIHKLRNKSLEVPEEVEAERDGIVYIKLEGEGSVGTLVNGAGLAMNTVDALTAYGAHCANFLDTGGKATPETVKSSFRVVLSDPRVKAIFVNIFGGLTRCDMIAEGIIMAFRELGIKVPVVVRLRGTNEEIGHKMIVESGLPLYAFDSFEEAAMKIINLLR